MKKRFWRIFPWLAIAVLVVFFLVFFLGKEPMLSPDVSGITQGIDSAQGTAQEATTDIFKFVFGSLAVIAIVAFVAYYFLGAK